ncbi:MAG: clostripain-related cysteine peptidase [Treponema sp.]|nr:clostripain-related cysteine peptidase [Treponema sp.]
MKRIIKYVMCLMMASFVFASCDFYETYGLVRIQELTKNEVEKNENVKNEGVEESKEEGVKNNDEQEIENQKKEDTENVTEKTESNEDEENEKIENSDERDNNNPEKKSEIDSETIDEKNENLEKLDESGDQKKEKNTSEDEKIEDQNVETPDLEIDSDGDSEKPENWKESIRELLQEILNSQKEPKNEIPEETNLEAQENDSLESEEKNEFPYDQSEIEENKTLDENENIGKTESLEKNPQNELLENKSEDTNEKEKEPDSGVDKDSEELKNEEVEEKKEAVNENPDGETTSIDEKAQSEIPEDVPEIVETKNEEPFRRKWTFIVYMAGDNALEASAIQDLNEIEAGIVDEKDISVLTLLDRHPGFDGTNGNWSDTRLFEVMNDQNGRNGTIISKRLACSELDLYTRTETELDMGNPNTLSHVIDFAQREFEAENYVLVVWGYGYGWRGFVKDGSSDTSLSLSQVREGVKNKGIHTIIFDTSFGLTAETICELKDECRYLAGTGGINSSAGMDYESFFKKFYESDRSQKSLFTSITGYSNTDFLVFDNYYGDEFMEVVNGFGKSLAGYIDSRAIQKKVLEDCLCNIRSYSGSSYPCDCYMDLNNMALFMKRYSSSGVQLASEKLTSLLGNACISGKAPDISIHLIPLLGKKVTASSHSEEYVKETSMINNGRTKIEFVNEGDFWVPTGNNQSFLDALFYRTY